MTNVNQDDDLDKAYKMWHRAISSSLISHEMTKAGLEVVKSDQRLSKCFGDDMDNFVEKVRQPFRDDADIMLYYATHPNLDKPIPVACKILSFVSNMQYEMEAFCNNDKTRDLAADHDYLEDVASRVVDAMAKTIVKHAPRYGIGFTHPSDIAKYQPQIVSDALSVVHKAERETPRIGR